MNPDSSMNNAAKSNSSRNERTARANRKMNDDGTMMASERPRRADRN